MTNDALFNFTDYRSFLKAYGDHQKATRKHWSYSVWAKALGFSSTAVLTNILNGKRHPGRDSISLFETYFAFDEKEQSYFRDLIRLQKVADDPQLASLLLERLRKNHPTGEFKVVSDQVFKFLAKPLYPALREMLYLPDFVEDIELIQKRLKVKATKAEIKRAIDDLIDLKIISRNEKGRLETPTETVDTNADYSSEALKQYHENMSEEAKLAIRSTALSKREFSGMSFCLKQDDLSEAKEMLRKFRIEFMNRFENQDRADEVYHLNLQFFPLTQRDNTGEK